MTEQSHKFASGSIRIRGQEVPVETREIDQKKLNFYVDNPRIYSLIRLNDYKPTQDEILEKMLSLEHVKELKEDIVTNDGLMDPLIVRDGDLVVLEGNSRLAAYRFLASKEPLRWSKVRCTVLPADIDERLVFALLGQYHVRGKKDWAPYEKAGFVYRRHIEQNIDLPTVATELGIKEGEATHLVNVLQFMAHHKDSDRDHWSYYDEYLKSRKIRKAREKYDGFDTFVVAQIMSGSISKAMDLRDKLPIICAGNPKIVKRFMAGTITFYDAYDDAVVAGGESAALNRLKRFRNWFALNETEEDILEMPKQIRDKAQFEIKEIEKRAHKLKVLLEKVKQR